MSLSKTNARTAPLWATLALGMAASTAVAQTVPTFNLGLGVRETGTAAAIGTDGGATGPIEYVGYKPTATIVPGKSFAADGNWHTITFTFGSESLAAFTGNGALDGTRGALEHIGFQNLNGVTDPIQFFVDDIVNTPSGGSPVSITSFEGFAPNQQNVVFRAPNQSPTTSANLQPASIAHGVSDASANTGTQSWRGAFQFVDGTTSRWIRLTTNASATLPNPTIDYTAGSTLSFAVRAVVTPVPRGWNVDADGDWSNATNWVGGVPNSGSATANFGGGIAITAPRTVAVDVPITVNTINFSSPVSYTLGAAGGTNTITMSAPLQFDANVIVSAGSHTISAPLAVIPSRQLVVNTSASTSLRIADLLPDEATTNFQKTGAGTLEVNRLRLNIAAINGGTTRILANGTGAATSEINSLTFAGGSAPTAKLDITNNLLIIDLDPASTPEERRALQLSTRGRIVNGFNGGDWLGNGIVSSTAAGSPRHGIGYGDAATLGITSFGDRPVDGEATLVRYTLRGDANLDGGVAFADLVRLAQNYNTGDPTGPNGPAVWSQGDFTYDGLVNFADLVALAQNYNQSLSAAQVSALGASFAEDFALAQAVPEPTTLLGAAAIALGAARRGRRSMSRV